MAWFLKGGALLDLGKTEAALSAYIQCAKMTRPRDSIHKSVLVRCDTCLSELKRFDQIPAIQLSQSLQTGYEITLSDVLEIE